MYIALFLLLTFIFFVYPPSVGKSETKIQSVSIFSKKDHTQIDSLKSTLQKIDSLVEENNKKIQKQQDTLNQLKTKQ